jgi:glycosyltransferase involved in cell wall biosynthesis
MISIFVPTSGRPAYFRDMLKSLGETAFGYDVEVVAVIDADMGAFDIAHEYNVHVIDYSPTRRGALNAWNIGLQLSSGDWLVPAGDDQIFHKNWLKYAIESFNEKLDGYGVLGMNDLAYDGNTQLATMWMFDRKYCQEHMGGIFAPPCYHYYCIDSGCKDAKVEHIHSSHGKRPVDTTDGYKEDRWMEEDNKTFEDRKARGFPVEWEPII